MKQKIYIETSVVSFWVARQSRNIARNIVIAGHQAATLEFWDRLCEYEVYISDIVIRESAQGDPAQAEKRTHALNSFLVLQLDEQAKYLARDFIESRVVPDKCPEDAL
jgi:hypothetical protein